MATSDATITQFTPDNERENRSSALRYIQEVQVDATTGDLTIDTIRLKKSWQHHSPEDRSGNVIVLPEEDSGPKRHRLAFMGVAKKLQNFRSTHELCKALYDTLQGMLRLGWISP